MRHKMTEFNFKTIAEDYKLVSEQLPETGKQIEVLCTMITKAKLVNVDPIQWEHVPDSQMNSEVKLWRDIQEA